MITLFRPTQAAIDDALRRAAGLPFSYAAVGASRTGAAPAGFVVDHRRAWVGRGEAAFVAARECLRRWDMFRLGWVSLCWPHVEPQPGAAVATLARFRGAWWLNPCRIVYVEDEPRRFRFAYGTVGDHVERGEERFTVEWLDDGGVWYDLYAFSRPASWLVRLGYPLARRAQARFGRDSLAAMAAAVGERGASA